MGNLYNARITFRGEGNFTFTLPNYGDLTVYAGRDIYIKGLTVSGVEALRQLRPLLLDHQLNGKVEGCFRVIDLNTIATPAKTFERAYKVEPAATVADLKAELVRTTGPIIEEVEEPKVEEPKVEEPKVEEPKAPEAKPTPKKPAAKKSTAKKSNNKKKK